jgi:hypothetical protein
VPTDVTVTSVAGAALVRVELDSTVDVDLRVRVRNELDGPVLPPRREGVTAAGWDDEGFVGVVPAGGRLGVGYACPTADGVADAIEQAGPVSGVHGDTDTVASDTDPEMEVTGTPYGNGAPVVAVELLGPATDDRSETDDDRTFPSDTVASVVRSLGRANPPADAVPVGPTAAANRDNPGSDGDGPGTDGMDPLAPDVPPSVGEWLNAVETRIQRAERLADGSAADAAATLENCGGVDAVAGLPDALDSDLASLREVSDRLDGLAARAATADPGPTVSALSEAAAAGRAEGR